MKSFNYCSHCSVNFQPVYYDDALILSTLYFLDDISHTEMNYCVLVIFTTSYQW